MTEETNHRNWTKIILALGKSIFFIAIGAGLMLILASKDLVNVIHALQGR